MMFFSVTFFTLYAFSVTSSTHFDESLIHSSSASATLLSLEDKAIMNENHPTNGVKLSEVPEIVKQAFISIEDKNFYYHNGINFKRIIKAMSENILSGQRRQGASTISQQLIKNTHLTNEKTLIRKIKEIKLALEMEKKISKEKIFEAYLNDIYFGGGCYGLAEASKYYFSCTPQELNLSQASLLAGLIKAPGHYSPISKPEAALKRRNLVLKQMEKDGIISLETTKNELQKPIILNISQKEDDFNTYTREAISEAEDILGLSQKQIASYKYKIYTYYEKDKQEALVNALEKENTKTDYCGISINNETGGVSAYYSSYSLPISGVRRQPGSAIKPVLIYAPALNQNIISPSSQILDEEISFSGYSPKNITKTYEGFVSAKDAISKSLNVPAVKIMSYVGIDNCINYASELGIPFEQKDTGYALALGGFTKGTTILELANSYVPFSNSGQFYKASFIRKIEDENGKIIYEKYKFNKEIIRNDTAYLLTSMLNTKYKNTTAKKLGTLPYDVSAKTGTVGTIDGKQNLDANCVAYTTKDTVAVWIGFLNNQPMDNYFTGGRQPASAIYTYFDKIYSKDEPDSFEMPSSVVEAKIDLAELEENHCIMLANDFTPERYTKTELFSVLNLPKSVSERFTKIDPVVLQGKIEGNKAILEFDSDKIFEYELFRELKDDGISLAKFENRTGKVSFETAIKNGEIVSFYLVSKLKNQIDDTKSLSAKSNKVSLIKTSTNDIIKNDSSNTQKKKWFL
ncbi:MAG: transglycosylase domain-containing protein [Clostridia bacterium]